MGDRFYNRKAGGHAFPCIVDIRSEEQVQEAVKQTVAKFGGIDILINNASAISLTGTLATPMKKYDLMNSINARGTYLWFVYLSLTLTFLRVLLNIYFYSGTLYFEHF